MEEDPMRKIFLLFAFFAAVLLVSPVPRASALQIGILGLNKNMRLLKFLQMRDLVMRIEQKAGGRLTFKFLGGQDVVPSRNMWTACAQGVVDSVWNTVGRATQFVPAANALSAAMMGVAKQRKTGFFDYYNKVMAKGGFYILTEMDSSDWNQNNRIYLRKRIKTLADLKGMKLGITSAATMPLFKGFGIIPVQTSPFDMYTSTERGLIDGFAMDSDDSPFRFSFPEVVHYFIEPGYNASYGQVWAFNLKAWNKIPKDLQKICINTAIETEEDWKWIWPEIHEYWIKKWIAAGMKPIKLSHSDAKKLINGFLNFTWADVIKRDPVNGPKLRELAGFPPLKP